MDRSEHEAAMVGELHSSGWDETFTAGPHPGPAVYTYHWRLPFHRPGETRRGRGTILVDMQRAVGRHIHYVSLKGYTMTPAKSRPSTVILTSGCGATIRAVVAAANRGNAVPVAIFASPVVDDKPVSTGLLAVFDAAPWIRASGVGRPDYQPPPPSLAGYGKGRAPPVYVGYESPKRCRDIGQSSDWVHRENGYAWYPQLKLSIPSAGIPLRRGHLADLPGMVDSLPWASDGWYTLY